MQKLVYLFRHTKPIAIGIKNRGMVIYPKFHMDSLGIEPIPGRPVSGVFYDFDYIHQIDLLPEQADELPESLRDEADPDFLREYKLSQARTIADNIKQNELTVRELKRHEAEGFIATIGRATVDHEGNIINKKDKEPVPVAPVTPPQKAEDLITVPERKKGRPPKKESE